MPIATGAPLPTAGLLLTVVPAVPGCTAQISGAAAPLDRLVPVVAWALVADTSVAGGARLDPVVIADGRTWTPDQFRAVYGAQAAVSITA